MAAAAAAVLDRVLREAADKQGGGQDIAKVEVRGDSMGHAKIEGKGDAMGLVEGLRRLCRE